MAEAIGDPFAGIEHSPVRPRSVEMDLADQDRMGVEARRYRWLREEWSTNPIRLATRIDAAMINGGLSFDETIDRLMEGG